MIDSECRIDWKFALPGKPDNGRSAYFVAGNAVYRVSITDGAMCSKQTVVLNTDEALTELTFVDGVLHASGPGILVRIADRVETKSAKPLNASQSGAPGSDKVQSN